MSVWRRDGKPDTVFVEETTDAKRAKIITRAPARSGFGNARRGVPGDRWIRRHGGRFLQPIDRAAAVARSARAARPRPTTAERGDPVAAGGGVPSVLFASRRPSRRSSSAAAAAIDTTVVGPSASSSPIGTPKTIPCPRSTPAARTSGAEPAETLAVLGHWVRRKIAVFENIYVPASRRDKIIIESNFNIRGIPSALNSVNSPLTAFRVHCRNEKISCPNPSHPPPTSGIAITIFR